MRCYCIPDEAQKILLDSVQCGARGAHSVADALDKKGMYTESLLWELKYYIKRMLDSYKQARELFEPDITIFNSER